MILPFATVAARLWAAVPFTRTHPMSTNTPSNRASADDWANAQETARMGSGYYTLRCLLELRARVEALENAADGVLWPEREPQPARAVKESLTAAPAAPAIEPPELSDREAREAWALWEADVRCSAEECIRRIYRTGWKAALAAVAQQQPAPPAPAPAGSLVEMLEREGYNRTHGRAAIRVVAEWLDSVGNNGSARDLREQADRG